MFPAPAKHLSLLIILYIVTTCHLTCVLGSRITRKPVKPASTRDHEPVYRHSSPHKNGSASDQDSDLSRHSIRLLPPPDMIIESFLKSRHAQRPSQRNPPPKQLARSLVPSPSRDDGGLRSDGRRHSSPPSYPRGEQNPLTGSALSSDIQALVPALNRLQKHAIPIDAISKDIEATIQRIVQDIVSRREKIFYHLPNNGPEKQAADWGSGARVHRPEERVRMPVLRSLSRPPLSHLPPPPVVHRGLFAGSERPAGNELIPYYAIARNGLAPGLKSFSEFVKKVSSKIKTQIFITLHVRLVAGTVGDSRC